MNIRPLIKEDKNPLIEDALFRTEASFQKSSRRYFSNAREKTFESETLLKSDSHPNEPYTQAMYYEIIDIDHNNNV